MLLKRIAVIAAISMAGATAAHAQAPTSTVIRAARMITIASPAVVTDAAIVVAGNRIVAAGPSASVSVPAGATVIDLGDVTLLPGFLDSHVHIAGRTLGDPLRDNASVRDFESYGAVLGVANALKTLMAGFTSIRVVGSPNFDDMSLRDAINDGNIPGPRLLNAGHSLGITGGHCDSNGWRPGINERGVAGGIANGPEEVRAAVRHQMKYGAEVIKTCATGGVLSQVAAVGTTQYSFEELKAMVDETRNFGRKVAAHAHGTEGIKIATRAGVASIEHGSFLDEEGAKLMARSGTYFVPTLMAGEAVEVFARDGTLTGLRAEKALAAADAMRRAIRLAVANKVPIAFGTDAGVIPHGTNAREFRLMVEWGGLSPIAALNAGTIEAAKLFGWEDRVGTLQPGQLADIVAVPGNPLENIQVTEQVSFVMKNGIVYRRP